MMTNLGKIRAMSAEELASLINDATCVFCIHQHETCSKDSCWQGIVDWLNQEANPMPQIKKGDIIRIDIDGGLWWGFCVTDNITYILDVDRCKYIKSVAVKAIFRWNSAGKKELIWGVDDE